MEKYTAHAQIFWLLQLFNEFSIIFFMKEGLLDICRILKVNFFLLYVEMAENDQLIRTCRLPFTLKDGCFSSHATQKIKSLHAR